MLLATNLQYILMDGIYLQIYPIQYLKIGWNKEFMHSRLLLQCGVAQPAQLAPLVF